MISPSIRNALTLTMFGSALLLGCSSSPTTTEPLIVAKPTPDKEIAPPSTGSVAIETVAMYQTVRVGLVADGAKLETRNAPVIANRPGMIRVFVTPTPDWKQREVIAELHMFAGGAELPLVTLKKTVRRASKEEDLATTFNFQLDAATLTTDLSWSVVLRDITTYPADGNAEDLGASAATEIVRIKLVPVQYDADDSGRLPSVGEAMLAAYRENVLRMYPTQKVEITVRKALPWPDKIEANGAGWEEVLQAVLDVREQDKAPADVYYIGVFNPAGGMGAYCQRGCVLGLAPVAGVKDASDRAAAIVGFPGTSEGTLVHELGHTMGREHAPCGSPAGPDKKFPYENGAIGVSGWNMTSNALISATDSRDMMGYCEPYWISDYTYRALFDRISAVNASKAKMPKTGTPVPPVTPKNYRFVKVGAKGELSWGRPITLREAPTETTEEVTFHDAAGNAIEQTRAHFVHYDHLPGGMMIVPEGPANFASIRVRGLEGRTTHAELARTF